MTGSPDIIKSVLGIRKPFATVTNFETERKIDMNMLTKLTTSVAFSLAMTTASFANDVADEIGQIMYGNGAIEGLGSHRQGSRSTHNEGFLEGYGAGTGMTPGPVEVRDPGGFGGGLGSFGGGAFGTGRTFRIEDVEGGSHFNN